MYSASLSCPGCFAIFEAHGTMEELAALWCEFCGTPLELTTWEVEGSPANTKPALHAVQGPIRDEPRA